MKKFISDIWKFKIAWLILLAAMFLFIPPHTGKKNMLFFFILGSFIYTLTFTLYYINNMVKKSYIEKPNPQIIFFNAGIIRSTVLIVLAFFLMQKMCGVRSVFIWAYFAAGLASDALLLVLASKKLGGDNEIISVAKSMQQSFYYHMAAIAAVMLGLYHFSGTLTGVLAVGYIITFSLCAALVFNFIMRVETRQAAHDIFYALFIAVFLAGSYFIVTSLIKNVNYFYCIAGGAISAFIIMALFLRNIDNKFINAALAALILIGNLWISFKFAAGFGLSLCAIGFLTNMYVLQPLYIYKEESEIKSGVKVLEAAGLFFVLVLLARLFMQVSGLYSEGISLSSGYFIVGLALGLFLPTFVEADTLLNPYKSGAEKSSSIYITVLNYIVLFILAKIAIVAVFIFLGIEPVFSALMGISMAAMVAFVYMFKNKTEDAIWNTSLGSLWALLGLIAFLVYPYIDILNEFSRMQKIGMILLVLIAVFAAYIFANKRTKPIQA